jgi:hypothetical protein
VGRYDGLIDFREVALWPLPEIGVVGFLSIGIDVARKNAYRFYPSFFANGIDGQAKAANPTEQIYETDPALCIASQSFSSPSKLLFLAT